jgi:hypothetical protein
MSHFTTVATKITNLTALKRALEKLKWAYTESTAEQRVEVRGWKGAKTTAEMSINMGKYDIGVVQNEDGTYGLVADWWGIEVTKGLTEQEVATEINREYAYQQVVLACEEQGYQLDQTEVAEDGTVKLSVSKWG